MIRSLVAVISGFVVIGVLVVLVETVMGQIMVGTFPALDEDLSLWTPSTTFLVGDLIIGAIAAILGGVTTGAIAKHSVMKHVYGLAALIVVMALFQAAAIAANVFPVSTGVGNMPLWHSIALPIVGVVGVIIGGRLWVLRQAQETSVFDMESPGDGPASG